MREVIVRIYCDVCSADLDNDTVNEIKTTTSTATYEADLCGGCLTAWLDHMRVAKTRTPAPKKRTEGDFECGECGNRYATQRGLSAHQTRKRNRGL